MSAPVSVVIPTLNPGPALGPTLAALTEGVMAGLVRELVLSDGGSDDDIAAIADAMGAALITGAPSRGGQLRRGADAATGPWLLFLHADTVLTPRWSDAVLRHLERAPDKAAVFRLAFDDPSTAARVVAGWANLRSGVFALPYGDQGLLIPRALYDAVGGYPEQPLMEDVAIIRAIGRRRFSRLDTVATTSADRYRRDGWVRRGARNWGTLIRYFLGADPEALAKRYRKGSGG